MSVLVFLILVSLGIAVLFLSGFVWAVRSGQFDDTYTPSLRPLMEDSQVTQLKPAPGKPAQLDSKSKNEQK